MKKTIAVLLFLFACFSLYAYDFTVRNYSVDISVGKNAVHEIDERYDVFFHNPKHGLIRYLPYDYSDVGALDARISDVMCSDPCSVFPEEGYYIFRIGDAGSYAEGNKSYRLAYSYDLGQDVNEGYDQFYYNLLGAAWDVPFESVSFSVFVPEEYSNVKIWLTRGYYGSSSQVDYEITESDNGFYVSGVQNGLVPGEALTLRIQFEDLWYEGARSIWDYRTPAKVLNPLLSCIVLIIAAVIWILRGRDNVPIISAKFNPPDGFSPLETGYITDNSADDKDIAAMLYYWADKGYITINEKKKNNYSFTKIFNIDDNAPSYEKELFNAFFKNADSTHSVSFKNLDPQAFPVTVQKVKAKLAASFRGEKALFDRKSKVYQVLLFVLSIIPFATLGCAFFLNQVMVEEMIVCIVPGVFCIVFTAVLVGSLFRRWYVRKTNIPSCLVCFIPSVIYIAVASQFSGSFQDFLQVVISVACSSLSVLFAVITSKRSEYGDKILEDVLGYREFIEKVSMSQLIMMMEKDPEYYYHVLSYAIVFNLADKWAEKFKNMTIAAPGWYIGNSPIDSLYFYHMSTRMLSSFRTSVVPPQTAKNMRVGGGGFNMSGFAGGGFGGGGGRAW